MAAVLLTAVTLLAFAANSILCRLALGTGAISPALFTMIRLASGALVLVPLARWSAEPAPRQTGSWVSGLALGGYAFAFSFAYVSITAGTGALVLFGMVQVTMLGTGVVSGDRPGRVQWAGMVLAFAGLVYLVSPGLAAPDVWGATLMAVAGVSWAVYSLRGRGVRSPVAVTAGNFRGPPAWRSCWVGWRHPAGPKLPGCSSPWHPAR